MIYLFLVTLFSFLNFFYIKIWKIFFNNTPTGSGIFLLIPLIYFGIISEIYIIIFILFLFSFAYFFDDLFGIKYIYRIILQILAAALIFSISTIELNFYYILLFISFFLIICNSLNFQDGQDLNIASLLIMIFCLFLFFSNNILIRNTSVITLIYLLVFLFFNSKSNNLYFGDNGCFISTIIIFLFLIEDSQNLLLIKYLSSIIIFPLTDVFFVLCFRIYKRENLLSRNFYHIYQILFKRYDSKFYLLPNILFAMINLIISSFLEFNMNYLTIILILNFFFVILLNFIIKKF